MFASVKNYFRNALGVTEILNRVDSFQSQMYDQNFATRGAIRDARREEKAKPIHACITVLCHTKDDSERAVTLGAEEWIQPGKSLMIPIFPDMPLSGRFTFFISGDPGLVITGFGIGNESLLASYGGCKYGVVSGSINFGSRINIMVEHRLT